MATTYKMMGYDTGTGDYVYWQSTGTPDLTPTTTSPALAGTLTNICILDEEAGTASTVQTTDWNTATATGFYVCDANCANAPLSTQPLSGTVQALSSGAIIQRVQFASVIYRQEWVRHRYGTTWTAWQEVSNQIETTNWDTALTTGSYKSFSSTTSNAPTTTDFFVGEVKALLSAYDATPFEVTQTVQTFGVGGSKTYQRHSYNNAGVLTWTTWGEQRLNKSEQDYLLSLKLDASAYNDRWKGLHVSLAALQTAHPTANAGDYANVDAGIGSAPDIYSWDATDSLWVKTSSSGSGATNTDALPEGSTNLYFTAVRAVSSLLTGFVAGAGIVSATDSILQAIQKIVGNLATGSVDNRLLRSNGTAGNALDASVVTVDDTGEIYGYAGKLNAQTGTTYTLLASDTGKIIDHNNASAVTVALPNNLPVGFCCTYSQTGAGQVTFSPSAGATLNSYTAKTKIAGQYAAVTIWVQSNNTGTNAVYVIAGAMA